MTAKTEPTGLALLRAPFPEQRNFWRLFWERKAAEERKQ